LILQGFLKSGDGEMRKRMFKKIKKNFKKGIAQI